MDEPIRPGEGILHHPEGVDLMPADIQLSGMGGIAGERHEPRDRPAAVSGHREGTVFPYPDRLSALPGDAHGQRPGSRQPHHSPPSRQNYLPAKGLEQLLSTINKVKRQLNPKLQIDGILLTMVDNRNELRQRDRRPAAGDLRQQNQGVRHRDSPFLSGPRRSAPRARASLPIDPGGKVAEGYKNLTKEVLKLEKQREKK